MSKKNRSKKSAVGKVNFPDAQEVNVLLAAFAAQQYLEVVSLAESMTARFPRQGFGWVALGIALKQMGRNEDALLPLKTGAALSPDDADAHNNFGVALMESGRLVEAEKSFQRALQINSDYAEVHNNLGNALREMNRREEAEISYRRAIVLKPDYAVAHNNLGVLLKDSNKLEEARGCVMRALETAPDYADAYSNLSAILLDMNLFDDSERACRLALQINPQHVKALNNLASTLKELMRLDEAELIYSRALAIDPGHVDSLHGLANLCLVKGDIDQARDIYFKILKDVPLNMAVRYSIAQAGKVRKEDENFAALVELDRKNSGASLAARELIYQHFALGKCYDDVGDYQNAFRHFMNGCGLKRSTLNYNAEITGQRFSALMTLFDREAIDRLRGAGNPSALPIFVLGMPRSGTTLVEQIIASHCGVHGAGELGDLLKIVESGGKEEPGHSGKHPSSERDKILRWGREYVSALQKCDRDAKRIIDKMPTNFFAIGLIHVMLPNAKIIHVNRNPIDTCLSCFTQLFSHANEHTYDLAELGQYYVAYAKLMEHWRKVLPEGAFLDVNYEDVVSDQETQARRMIEYCGLEWNDACLDFHQNARPIQTASIMQVRQPIYKSSVERWRRYEKPLGPLLEALGDLALVR